MSSYLFKIFNILTKYRLSRRELFLYIYLKIFFDSKTLFPQFIGSPMTLVNRSYQERLRPSVLLLQIFLNIPPPTGVVEILH